MAEASNWYRDGVDHDDAAYREPRALRALEDIDRDSPELAEVVSGWDWVFDEDLNLDEVAVIEYLADLTREGPALVQPMVELPWIADGIDDWEVRAAGHLWLMATHYDDVDFAVELATTPWVVDGVTFLEAFFGIEALIRIAGEEPGVTFNAQDGTSEERDLPAGPELARQVMGLIGPPSSERDIFLLRRLNDIREDNPDTFERLLTEPWFVDGLDDEERILLIAAGALGYGDQLSQPHTVASRTITLPHSGNINLWGVWLDQSLSEQAILAELEKAVRGSERFWELPFPAGDVILYVKDSEECTSKDLWCLDQYLGDMMLLVTYEGGPEPDALYRQVGRYYFNDGTGPPWFWLGGAEFVRHYIANDGNVPTVEFPDYCAEQGVGNLQALGILGYSPGWCARHMGLHLMATLRDTMGGDAWLAALRALHLESDDDGVYLVRSQDSPWEEDVYRAFMEHTPPELVDEVRDVFRRLHGGPFVEGEDQAPALPPPAPVIDGVRVSGGICYIDEPVEELLLEVWLQRTVRGTGIIEIEYRPEGGEWQSGGYEHQDPAAPPPQTLHRDSPRDVRIRPAPIEAGRYELRARIEGDGSVYLRTWSEWSDPYLWHNPSWIGESLDCWQERKPPPTPTPPPLPAPGEPPSPAVREYAAEVCEQMERVGEVLASVLPEWESPLGEYPARYTAEEAVDVGESAFETLYFLPQQAGVQGMGHYLGELHSLTMGVAGYATHIAGVLSGRYHSGPGVALEFLVQENERIASELHPTLGQQLYALCPAAVIPVGLLAEVPLPDFVTGPAQE